MDGNLAQTISAIVSGIFGAGFASWLIKQAIGRSISKIDQLEIGLNNLNTMIATMSVKLGDLADVKRDQKVLEREVSDMRHYMKECEEMQKDHKEANKAHTQEICNIRDKINAIERQIDRLHPAVAKGSK